MKIVACYIRVSTEEENQAKQRREIHRWLKSHRINQKAVRWYIDKSTDDAAHRPRFERLQADILAGKVRAVVVCRLDRLPVKTSDGLNVLSDWCDKSLRVVAVSQQIDFRSTDCEMIASILRSVARMDQERMRERTRKGLAAARACGRMGRPGLAADDARVLLAKKLHKDTSLSIDDNCKRLGVSRSTYYRYVGL